MTQNEIAYWANQEQARHNRAQEGETERSNRAKELETNRANIEKERETNRSNLERERETRVQNAHTRRKETSSEIRGWFAEAVNKPVISAAESAVKAFTGVGGLLK